MANLKYKDGDTWNSLSVIRGPKGDNANITVNGQTKENASFYAAETGGTPGQTLIAYGDGKSPQWSNLAAVATSGNYEDLNNLPTVPTTTNDIVSGSEAALTSGGAYTALGQRGIPAGGSSGEVLIKNSSNDYDSSWRSLTNIEVADRLKGFSKNRDEITWGALADKDTYEFLNTMDDKNGGSLSLASSGGQTFMQIDGCFFQKEGYNRVLDTGDLGNYAFYKFPAGTKVSSSSSPTKEVTITTKGRPIFVSVTGDNNPDSETAWMYIYLYRDGVQLCCQICESHALSHNIPFALNYLDIVGAGTHTYKVTFSLGSGTINLAENGALQSPNFVVFEI